MSAAELLERLGESLHLVDCLSDEEVNCQLHEQCNIRQPIARLNRKIYDALASTMVQDLFDDEPVEDSAQYLPSPN